jgi:ferrous iron transport protein A
MSLGSVPLSATVRVTGIRAAGPLGCRLMEMGLIEGALVQVVGRAPLGDPMRVRLGDYELSLRTSEADLVDVASI